MIKKEMIAMLLAGGQGSRLGVLTSKGNKMNVFYINNCFFLNFLCIFYKKL